MVWFYFQNSFKNLLRSKIKSVFFMLLVFILTVISCISLSVWVSIESYLDSCDAYYDSIALLEYMGPEYPDDTYYDSSMQEAVEAFDFEQFKENSQVLSVDRSGKALGYIEGYERFDNFAEYKEDAVIIAEVTYEVADNGDVEVVSNWGRKALYCNYDIVDQQLYLEGLENWLQSQEVGVNTESGVYTKSLVFYCKHGDYNIGIKEPFELMTNQHNTIIKQVKEEGGFEDLRLIQDITGQEAEYSLEGDNLFSYIAKTYYVGRHALEVTATSNMELLLPFNQQQINLQIGRYISEEEYKIGAKVCVINEVMAERLEVTVGETISLSISVLEGTVFRESYWAGRGFDYTDEYVVVGIVRSPKEMIYNVYIPVSEDIDLTANQMGYTLATLHLKNASADTFYNTYYEQLPERFFITIYDQGYSNAAKPLEDIHKISILTALTSILATLIVMLIFSYLYVYRQRATSDIMIKLGTGKLAVYQYFLNGMLMISIVAIAIGVFVSNKLFSSVKEIIGKALSGYIKGDVRYSNGNLSIINALEYEMDIDIWLFILIALGIVALTFICGIYFTHRSLKAKKKVKRVYGAKREHRSSTVFSGHIKYAYFSIMRGGFRTVLVVVIVGAMILFIGQLTNTMYSYEENISQLKEDTVISLQFTDVKGRQVNKALIEAFYIRDIIESGFVEDLSLSRGIPYKYMGIEKSEAKEYSILPLEFPDNRFAQERFTSELAMGPNLIFTNNVETTPQFYFGSGAQIEYLEGYDSLDFEAKVYKEGICIIPDTLLESEQIKLGDTIKIYRHWNAYWWYDHLLEKEKLGTSLKVVGVYVNETSKDYIYTPLNSLIDMELFYVFTEESRKMLFSHLFDSGSFVLKDTTQLDEFREFLAEYGCSEATKIRTHRCFVVLDDKAYVSTLDTLNQQLKHIQILYPILYILIGIAGFIVAFLVTVSRQKELSLMRGLGASKLKTFVTFFIEQVLLIIVGAGVGLGISSLIYEKITTEQINLMVAVSLAYLLGAVVSLLLMNRFKVMKMLKVED